MSTGSYLQCEAKCPFYKRDANMRKIACEGLVDASNIILSYKYLSDFERQFFSRCAADYRKCAVYKMLVGEKYKDE